ncbi:MAG: membrane protease subunit, stomatin/prohibitin [Crocinitomix sp.]|nr:membrane protease subunit, stomatin/prohibitin [Crocinitomix sp.]
MFGFNYIKFDSMDYVIQYQNGKVRRKGNGLSFFYFAASNSLVSIPMKSIDLPFIFEEITADYQDITIQGQLTFKISSPDILSKQLDFTVGKNRTHLTDDMEKLRQRLINEAQASITGYVNSIQVTEVLSKQVEIGTELSKNLRVNQLIQDLGIEILGVSILSIKATPETARALEAKTREAIQQEADEAIYGRRNFAVEQERKIQESELNTEIAVEEKNKQIVEKKMQTDLVKSDNQRKLSEMKVDTAIAVESKNKDLVEMKTANDKKEADAQAYLLEAVMSVYKNVDWKILSALQGQDNNAASNIALAFRELAANSSKIGTLNITPDLLDTLLTTKKK